MSNRRTYTRKPPTFTPEEIQEIADKSEWTYLELVELARYHPYMLRDLQIEHVGITPSPMANSLLEKIPVISTVVKIGKAITRFRNSGREKR